MTELRMGVALIVAGCLLLLAYGARAQDGHYGHGHAENHDWYKNLQTNQGYSCCNGDAEHGDCRPAAVWRDAEGRVWTRIDGNRTLVPPAAVLPDRMNQKPLTGHICERGGYFYCALVGGAGG